MNFPTNKVSFDFKVNSNFDSSRWQIIRTGVTLYEVVVNASCLTIVIATAITFGRRKVQNRMYIGYKYLRNAYQCVTLTSYEKHWQTSNKTHRSRAHFC